MQPGMPTGALPDRRAAPHGGCIVNKKPALPCPRACLMPARFQASAGSCFSYFDYRFKLIAS
jgi:hypothetical protein